MTALWKRSPVPRSEAMAADAGRVRPTRPLRIVRRRGRPAAIPAEARGAIRSCYEAHYGQWGPQVLAAWCRREALGEWSASTIAAAIADLRAPEPPAAAPRRYEVTAADVIWSEDGTAFRRAGRKQELLVVHDEHARKKLNWPPARAWWQDSARGVPR